MLDVRRLTSYEVQSSGLQCHGLLYPVTWLTLNKPQIQMVESKGPTIKKMKSIIKQQTTKMNHLHLGPCYNYLLLWSPLTIFTYLFTYVITHVGVIHQLNYYWCKINNKKVIELQRK